jgi:hypothetical protein
LKLFLEWGEGHVGKDEGEWWIRRIQVGYIIRTFVNVKMYLHQAPPQKKEQKVKFLFYRKVVWEVFFSPHKSTEYKKMT